MKSYDYIIVGAGSAGCVLANRLTTDPKISVLLLEAGKRDDKVLFKMPLAFVKATLNPDSNWRYMSEPDPTLNNRVLPVPRGKVLGGSSSINGMMYARGHARDFDQWRQLGLEGWSFADILPYYKRLEADWRGDETYHGGSGPLTTTAHNTNNWLFGKLIETAKSKGYKQSTDLNGVEAEGFGGPDFTIKNGRRASTAAAFLRPVLHRPNLAVETEALSRRVLVEKGRAIGIEYMRGGQSHTVHADREVILSGGAYNSPQLLMLSGIGPADDIKAHGIAPIHDLPGVGRNLQEHACIPMRRLCRVPTGFDARLRFDRIAVAVLQWALTGRGTMASLPLLSSGFIRTRAGLERPDIQYLINAITMDSKVWFPFYRQANGDKIDWVSVLLHPESRGFMTLRSADPTAPPRIQFNLLEARNDLVTLRDAVKIGRDIMNTPPFSDFMGEEIQPGPAAKTDAEIEAALRNFTATTQHPVGTCTMGTGPEAVVDATLKLRGMDGLRVVDASVMPLVPGGNTNAPTIMIAEKASDMILGRAPLAPAEGLYDEVA